uniref:Rho-GAP domain-containing protein n=1 Tax=Rhabditophanes sp. KR3021 TaxID=114890 RepID=A0AC35U5P0_9BILA
MNSLKKRSPNEFHHNVKSIKHRMDDQLRCFLHRGDMQVSLLGEIMDFLRKKNHLDMEYAKKLEKLSNSYSTHLEKEKEKAKNVEKENYTNYDLLQTLISNAKDESGGRLEAVRYIDDVINPFIQSRQESTVIMVKNVNQICITAQNEIYRVIEELSTAMKIYTKNAEDYSSSKAKLSIATDQLDKAINSNSKRKQQDAMKYHEKRQNKYDNIKLQCDRSRNEYILCVSAANAAMAKYYNDDISDIVDCADLGTQHWLFKIVEALGKHKNFVAAFELRSKDNLHSFAEKIDLKNDKALFVRLNNKSFMLPSPFKFKPEFDDDVEEIRADQDLMRELSQRHAQIKIRIKNLNSETDDTWNILQDLERTILKMSIIPAPEDGIFNFTICRGFMAINNEQKEGIQELNKPVNLADATDAYTTCFRQHLLTGNVLNRLIARSLGIENSLVGSASVLMQDNSEEAMYIKHLAMNNAETAIKNQTTPRQQHRRRIGSLIVGEQVPKLFGGTVEEYCFLKGCLIPPIIVSCVNAIRDNALTMQGLFRLSATNSDLMALKDAFEKGHDPLQSGVKTSDIHAICCVLKLYLRELREPMIPFAMFDYCVESWGSSKESFLECIRKMFVDLSQPVWFTLRYLFAFFDHICENNALNCMDAYNLAVCLGPAMLPIPEDRDPIQYHRFVNDFLQQVITKHKLIFCEGTPGPVYHKESTRYRLRSIGDSMTIESDEDNNVCRSPDKSPLLNGKSIDTKSSGGSQGESSKLRTPSDLTENNSTGSEQYGAQSDISEMDIHLPNYTSRSTLNMALAVDALHTITPLDEMSPSADRNSIWSRRLNKYGGNHMNTITINGKTCGSELEEAMKKLASIDSDDAISCIDQNSTISTPKSAAV